MDGEPSVGGIDEARYDNRPDEFNVQATSGIIPPRKNGLFWRTKRQLPAVADPYAELKKAHSEGKVIQFNYGQAIADWCDMERMPTWVDPVKRYRVKPSPVMVPLGPEDVPPGSVLRGLGWVDEYAKCWIDICETTPRGVHLNRMGCEVTYQCLRENWVISRHDGKGFVRCEKEAK